jgi:hypothetical protein
VQRFSLSLVFECMIKIIAARVCDAVKGGRELRIHGVFEVRCCVVATDHEMVIGDNETSSAG